MDQTSDGILDLLGVPSPPKKKPRNKPKTKKEPILDLPKVLELAQHGHTQGEILICLGIQSPLEIEQQQEFQEAVRRGHALGRAEIKKAQYQAALEGKVTAQSQVLGCYASVPGELLGYPGQSDEALPVRRVFLDEQEDSHIENTGAFSASA